MVVPHNYVQRDSIANGDCLGQDMSSVVPEYAQNEECDFLIMYTRPKKKRRI